MSWTSRLVAPFPQGNDFFMDSHGVVLINDQLWMHTGSVEAKGIDSGGNTLADLIVDYDNHTYAYIIGGSSSGLMSLARWKGQEWEFISAMREGIDSIPEYDPTFWHGYAPEKFGFWGSEYYGVSSDEVRYIYFSNAEAGIVRFDTETLQYELWIPNGGMMGEGRNTYRDAIRREDARVGYVWGLCCVPEEGYMYWWDQATPVDGQNSTPLLRRASMEYPYSVETLLDLRVTPHWNIIQSQYVDWSDYFRLINPVTNLPHYLDPDIAFGGTGLSYKDGYIYWVESQRPIYLAKGLNTQWVADNYSLGSFPDSRPGAIRRIATNGGDVETLLYTDQYNSEFLSDWQRTDTYPSIRYHAYDNGVGVFCDNYYNDGVSFTNAGPWFVREGESFNYLGGIEVVSLSATQAVLRVVGPDPQVFPSWQFTLAVGADGSSVQHAWYDAYGLDSPPNGTFPHWISSREEWATAIVGNRYLCWANYHWDTVYNPWDIVALDLDALIAAAPIRFNPYDPPFEYLVNKHPIDIYYDSKGYGILGENQGGNVRGNFIAAESLCAARNPASKWWGKLLWMADSYHGTLNDENIEGFDVGRWVSALEPSASDSELEIVYDMQFAGKTLKGYQAQRPIATTKRLPKFVMK